LISRSSYCKIVFITSHAVVHVLTLNRLCCIVRLPNLYRIARCTFLSRLCSLATGKELILIYTTYLLISQAVLVLCDCCCRYRLPFAAGSRPVLTRAFLMPLTDVFYSSRTATQFRKSFVRSDTMAPPPPASMSMQERILSLVQTLQFGWFAGHVTLLLCTIRYAMSYLTFNYYSRWARYSYRTAFVAAAVTYGIVVFKSFRARARSGKPQNSPLAIIGDENVQYLCMWSPLRRAWNHTSTNINQSWPLSGCSPSRPLLRSCHSPSILSSTLRLTLAPT